MKIAVITLIGVAVVGAAIAVTTATRPKEPPLLGQAAVPVEQPQETDARTQQERVEAEAGRELEELKATTEAQGAQLEQSAREAQEAVREELADRIEEGAGAQELSGTVTSVTPTMRTMAIREEQAGLWGGSSTEPAPTAPTQVKVSEEATITMEGRPLPLSEVRVGDRVKAELHEEGSQRIVHSLVIAQRAMP